ncbi:MAG TPA: DEAD/DEAH box helicase, partial [Ktedonobacter sp.]|nr:DEAD/DEAH box helicase [Ktedonobacter sp.]
RANTPIILTTSQLLTTGVDAPTCKNIVIARVINSMIEFKQIIGRGTRVRDDYDKYYFTILDYTGSASRLFADPDFDGDPVVTTEEQIDDFGNILRGSHEVVQRTDVDDLAYVGNEESGGEQIEQGPLPVGGIQKKVRTSQKKYYVDGGRVEIIGDQVYELDAD